VRAHNDKSLVETLVEVLQDSKGPMGVKDIVAAVERPAIAAKALTSAGW